MSLIKREGFESLSYYWGSWDKPYSIFLPEEIMAITKSLHAAGYLHDMMNGEGARSESGKLKISVYDGNWPVSSYYLI